MQVNDFKNIQEAIKYEVLQDEKEYLKLLKVIGKLVRPLICGRNILVELL
ncbi:hypothetical protein [Anaerococcus vaginalis]